MFKDRKIARGPYEVCRSVGFKLSGRKGEQPCVFTMRLDVVRRAGQAAFSPQLWIVNPMAGGLMLSEMQLPADLGRATEEETLEAALAYVKSTRLAGQL